MSQTSTHRFDCLWTYTGDCEIHGHSCDHAHKNGSAEEGAAEEGVGEGCVSQKPGDPPKGTMNVAELHQQMKGLIEK